MQETHEREGYDGSSLVQQRRDLFARPDVIRHARRHGRSAGIRVRQRCMHPREVVVHELERHGSRVILDRPCLRLSVPTIGVQPPSGMVVEG